MKQYIEAITDELTAAPLAGAEVWIYDDDNNAAVLYAADGTTEIDNPLTTNEDGEFSFYSPTTELTALVYYGKRLRRRLRLLIGGGYSIVAQSAAQAALAASGVGEYPNTTLGLAGTALSETFWVDLGTGIGQVYRHDAGPVATALQSFIIDPTAPPSADVFAGGVPTTAALASSTGATMVGVGNDRLQSDLNAEVVSVFDDIPFAEQAAILAGTSTFDCTSYLHQARDAVKGTGKTLRFPGGTYYVGLIVWDGTGYKVDTAPGVVFQQKTGLTTDGGGEYAPIWNVTGTGIAFGDAHFIGNIENDFGQSSHAVAITSGKNCSFGAITATDIRGDVVYSYGRTTSESEKAYGNSFKSISGTNVYRNRIGMSGGEMFVENMPASGPYGYRDIHLEPNAEGSYQEPILRFGIAFLGVAEFVSNDDVDKSGAFIGDYLDLDLDRVEASVPPFDEGSVGPGVDSYAISLGLVRTVNIRYLRLRNYNSNPISLGDGWESFEIGVLDAANCVLTEVTYRSLIVQIGTAGPGALRIGVLIWPDGSDKWIARVQTSGKLNIDIGAIEAQCLIGTDLTGRIGPGSVDVDDSDDVVIGSSLALDIVGVTFTDAAAAIGVFASDNVRFTDCTATFGTVVNTSTRVSAVNSSINGSTADGLNYITSDGAIRMGGTKVLGAQGAAVADATDAASAITQLNALLARCRAHGLIA